MTTNSCEELKKIFTNENQLKRIYIEEDFYILNVIYYTPNIEILIHVYHSIMYVIPTHMQLYIKSCLLIYYLTYILLGVGLLFLSLLSVRMRIQDSYLYFSGNLSARRDGADFDESFILRIPQPFPLKSYPSLRCILIEGMWGENGSGGERCK